jgi:ACS family glucarate transporter-like MFS transporter
MKSVVQTPNDRTIIPVRYIVLAMIFIVSTLNYASRATLSMAGSAAQKELGFNSLQPAICSRPSATPT